MWGCCLPKPLSQRCFLEMSLVRQARVFLDASSRQSSQHSGAAWTRVMREEGVRSGSGWSTPARPQPFWHHQLKDGHRGRHAQSEEGRHCVYDWWPRRRCSRRCSSPD